MRSALAIDDQLRAGLDRITDGEMQRVDFNLGFYEYLRRPRAAAAATATGVHRPTISATGTGPSARSPLPTDWASSRNIAGSANTRTPPIKMPVPGPFTLSGCIDGGSVYDDRKAVTTALVPIVNAELKALVAAGVDFIQLDEPSFACHPGEPEFFLETLARTVEGVNAYISMHLCFGNYRARAVGASLVCRALPAPGQGTRQPARARIRQPRDGRDRAARGDSRDDGRRRRAWSTSRTPGSSRPSWSPIGCGRCLRYVDARRVSITPDCGFSQTARHVAVAKAKAMVEGARLVRKELKR